MSSEHDAFNRTLRQLVEKSGAQDWEKEEFGAGGEGNCG